MEEVIKSLGIISIGSISIASLVAFLGKSYFKWQLRLRTAEFQARLNNETELFKANLNIESAKFQVQFTKLHEDRALIIKQMYEYVVKLEEELFTYLNLKSNNESELIESYNTLLKYHKNNEIVFEEEISSLVYDLIFAFKECWVDYSIHLNFGDWHYLELDQKKEKAEFSKNAREKFKTDIPKLKKALRDEFRKLLGIQEI